jgi:hypothetical protein
LTSIKDLHQLKWLVFMQLFAAAHDYSGAV